MDNNTIANLIAAYLKNDKRTFEIVSRRTIERYSKWEKVTIKFTKWTSLCGMRHYLEVHHVTGKVYPA